VPSLELPAHRSAAARARRFVSDTLVEWGVEDGAIEDCRLLVSELVTNAILHARSSAFVSLERKRRVVRVTVCDESTIEPRVREYALDAVTGRGMLLVDRIARRWGVDARNGGKCVWFEMDAQSSRRAMNRSHEAI
jgi:anti-sigma regulatory factor (Ser/Thr protein kinase)